MVLLDGWLLEGNVTALEAFMDDSPVGDVDFLVNLAVARMCNKPELPSHLCPMSDRPAAIQFLKVIFNDPEYLKGNNLHKSVKDLNNSDEDYVSFCEMAVEAATLRITSLSNVPEVLLNTRQYSEIVRQSYFTATTPLIQGWIHPLSTFDKVGSNQYEATNLWAIANIYAAALTGKYTGTNYRASTASFPVKEHSTTTPQAKNLIARASKLNSAYLILINTIKHENEGKSPNWQ